MAAIANQGSNLQNSIFRLPGETFRVLKEKEKKQYGEYRTHRLVLKGAMIWESTKK